MKSIFLFLSFIFLCIPVVVFSQPLSKTSIFQISDSLSKHKLEKVSVLIMNNQKKIIAQGQTNAQGVYETQAGSTNCKVVISFPEYATHYINLHAKPSDTIKIYLIKKIHDLNEVVIVSKKSHIEDLGDRLIYHVGKDITTGGDASELLRKIPLVSIDRNGKPTIKSNTNIKILVNGQAVAHSDPAMALKMIPADQINKVEVITSPSAKYEAAGTAGIINIITIKKSNSGTSGMFNGRHGYITSDLYASLAYTNKKITLSGSSGNYWGFAQTAGSTDVHQTKNLLNNKVYSNTESGNFKIAMHYHQLGAAINLDNKNSFIIDLTSSNYTMNTAVNSESQQFLINSNQSFSKQNTTNAPSTSHSAVVNYQHLFNNSKKELNVKMAYAYHTNQPWYNFNQTDFTRIHSKYFLQDHNYTKEFNSQVDYQFPSINNNHLFEVGANTIYRQMGSNSMASNSLLIINSTSNTKFDYQQLITSLFASGTFKISNQFNLRSGLRLENVANHTATVNQHYTNLFPNVGITFNPSSTQSLSFNFNTRIERPSIHFLNPTNNQSDQIVTYQGNPTLRPEYTQNYELSFSSYLNNNYLKTAIYQSITQNSIHSLIIPTNNVLMSEFNNVGIRYNSGISVFGTLNIADNISINTDIDLNYVTIKSDAFALRNEGLSFKTSLGLSYQLNKTFSIQYWGSYNSPKVTLQGTESSYSYSSIFVKKDFKNKLYSITFGVDNPFRQSLDYEVKNELSNGSKFSQVTSYYDRSIQVGFQYKFGKAINKPVAKKLDNDLKSIDNGRQTIN